MAGSPSRSPRLPARLGAALASPVRALRAVDGAGTGGFRDALWLVLFGVLCFRLEDVARALIGLSHVSVVAVIQQALAPLSRELIDAGLIVIPAALLVTIAAGRGRRDPSLDLELAAVCYTPFFAVRSLYRAADLDALFGPLPRSANLASAIVGAAWSAALVVLAIGVARRRAERVAGVSAETPPAPAVAAEPAPIRDRVAVTMGAAVLGLAFATNAVWVVRHGDAIAPLRRGSEAPSFALPRVQDGAPFDLRSLRGRVVLLDFWATWCPPCVQMIPTLHAVHDEWASRGVELVGINSDGAMRDADELRAFLQEHPAPYPMLVDDGRAAKLYRVVSLPHLVLLDRQGSVVKTFWGYTRKSEIDDALAAATGQPAAR